MDGCRELKALLRVILPMARPAIAAVALFQFFYSWNDYFGPLLYTSENPARLDAQLRARRRSRAPTNDWNLTMAATLLVMAPVIMVFFFAQKAFIEGVTLTGVKG